MVSMGHSRRPRSPRSSWTVPLHTPSWGGAPLRSAKSAPCKDWGEELTFSSTTVDSGCHPLVTLLHPWERWAPLLVVSRDDRARTPAETIVFVLWALCA